MSNLRPHPRGLSGWLAELDARIKADDAVIARDSAMLADRLRRQGREAVAQFLADATRVKEVTPADREALAKFLVTHTPEDTLRDAAARRLRDLFLSVESTFDFLSASPHIARIAALLPLPLVGLAVATKIWEPVVTYSHALCTFAAATVENTIAQFEFFRETTLATPPSIWLLLVVLAIAAVGGFRSFISNALVIAALIAGVHAYANFSEAHARATEPPQFCGGVDLRSNTLLQPTQTQIRNIRPAQK